MNRRPVGVTILTALYLLSGAMGLVLVLYGLFDSLVWSAGGLVLASSSGVLGWGLWRLYPWARVMAMGFNLFAILGQIGLGFWLIADSDGAGLAGGLVPFAGAALGAFATWYLARPLVQWAFRRPGGDTTILDNLTKGRFAALASEAPAPDLDQPPPALMRALGQGVAAPPVAAWLVARSGPQVGQQFLLNRERNTIGRDAVRASIRVDDPLVSRQHAQFNFEKGQVLLYDLASTNGTFVNNRRIQKQTLSDGDVVRVGQTEFVFKQMA